MTTELINELRSAAATLRDPMRPPRGFPIGYVSAEAKVAAELLDRAAEKIQETELAVMAAASEVTRWKRIYDDYAHVVAEEAANLYRDQSNACHRARYWKKRAKRAEHRAGGKAASVAMKCIRFYFGGFGWGWRLFGIASLRPGSMWFIGLSRQHVREEEEAHQ